MILLIDIEKAYDRVNSTFIQQTMKKLGFSKKWVKWTIALYWNAQSTILVNKQKSQKFTLERSVRQGCLLVPYLYLFILDVLSYMINYPTYVIDEPLPFQ